MNLIIRILRGISRVPVYMAVLRPSLLIAVVIVYLPLTAIESVSGNSMFGNLFVDYDFKKAFYFGLALSGAVWALMLTTCLTLDFARDRQDQQGAQQRWIHDPGQPYRWVTIPISRALVFYSFTSLALPAVFIVVLRATSARGALMGLLIGGLASYILMNAVAAFVQAHIVTYQVLPWRHTDWIASRLRSLGAAHVVEFVRRGAACFAKGLRWSFSLIRFVPGVPSYFFEDGTRLKRDHFFATISTLSVIIPYAYIYYRFNPDGGAHSLEEVPPAGFIFALLLPLIWIIAALWAWLGRYRLALYVALALSFFLSCTANPFHTYDVAGIEHRTPLKPHSILQPQDVEQSQEQSRDGKQWDEKSRKNLIIVAASGGGILAAGWTAQVLTKLHIELPNFAKELRLISGVSGGSVGAAHYVNSISEIRNLNGASKERALNAVAEDAMTSSLASTSYGVAFPDFRRVIFPFWLDEEFDRARLLEKDWRRIGNCRKQPRKGLEIQSESEFRQFCRDIPEADREKLVWFSDWLGDIEKGLKPAVIFNTTVMETGERIAITPLSTIQSNWAGISEDHRRRKNARTLSEFLSAEATSKAPADWSEADEGQKKNPTCSQYRNGSDVYRNGYDIDVWTAARLSATFSYVSPAARAACFHQKKESQNEIQKEDHNERRSPSAENSPGELHLIDGGYHDNYGVASALDWLSAALEAHDKDRLKAPDKKPLPVSRIGLVEIRAKPDIPAETAQNEWSSTWLGPFWGLFNSWGYAQLSSNDRAVNQRIADFKKLLASAEGVEFESFLFMPKDSGPLSWHLSEKQKAKLRSAWHAKENQKVLIELKEFLRMK